MIKIYPSLLVQDTPTLLNQLHALTGTFDHFQIDIADGIYVESKTLTVDDILTAKNDFLFLTEQKKTVEMHLMVEDFTSALPKIDQLTEFLTITRTFIHLSPFQKAHHSIPNTKYPVCMSINPDEDVATNFKILRSFDAVQIMTVQPGKQGQPFVPEAVQKINELRHLGFEGEISLDGAMNADTFPIVLQNEFLPNAVCPGSYFVKNNLHEALKRLRDMENETRLA